MGITARLSQIEKKLNSNKAIKVSPSIVAMREATRLCCLPKSDPETEIMSRTLAEKVIATLMAKEDPESPHYPLAIADALAERYRLDLARYTVNERHAAVIRGG